MSDVTATKPLPDASYNSSLHHDLTRLRGFGANVAAYVDALEGLKGKLPHGALALVNGVYTARKGEGPTSPGAVAADYPAEPAAGAMMVIETSAELTLTQDRLPGGHHLLVCGDIVTIKGRLYLPGRHLVILARELRTVAVPGAPGQPLQQAEIDVSAPEPMAQAVPIVPAAAQGPKGATARQSTFFSNNGNPAPGSAPDELGGAGGRGADGADGSRGAEGQRGGDIVIVCSRVGAGSTLWVNASGGRGGHGSPGQAGGTGGTGGDGKDSCDLNAGKAGVYDFLDGSYRYAAALEPGPGGLGGSGGIGGPGGTGGATGNFTLIVNQPLADDTVIENHSLRGQDGLPGEHGAAGQTGSRGSGGGDHRYDRHATGSRVVIAHKAEGAAPLSGRQRLEALQAGGGLPERLRTPPARWGRHLVIHGARATDSGSMTEHPWSRLRGIARVSHLHQLTETTRLRYLLWDALRFAADPAAPDLDEEIGDRLDYLLLGARLLKFVSKDEAQARSGVIATHAWMTLNRARGLDYFGQVPEHVELGPPSMHLQEFDKALSTLHEREQAWHLYAQALAGQSSLSDARTQAARLAESELKDTQTAVQTRVDMLTGCLTSIRTADTEIRAARDRLRPALTTLEAWVRSCIGLTPDDFIDVLFNLAFVGSPITEGPKRTFEVAGHGAFTAFTTLTSQTAKLVHKAIDTLPNDEGQPVRREHLLRRIDTFGGRLDDLKEAWTAINDARRPGDPSMIRLDDADAYRLLVVQRDFDELLDQFSTRPEAHDARVALDAFVSKVQQRNELIAEYNQLAGSWLDLTGRAEAAQVQFNEVTTLEANNSDPNLATETAFVAALYNRSREWCIESCYAASRAWRFFSLTPDDVLLSVLKLGNPREVNYTVLSAARETLGRKRSDQIRHLQLPHPPHWFPPKAAAPDVPGTYVTLLPQSYALSMPGVADAKGIPGQGRSQVHLAMCQSDRTLHLRIFDPRGKCVVDLPERSWKPSPLVDRLKRTYWPEELPLDTIQDVKKPWLQRQLIEQAMYITDCPVEPKADFRLHLSLTNNPGTVPAAGRSLICIAVGGTHMTVRVFDADGRVICDRSTMSSAPSSRLYGPELDQLRSALHPAASRRHDTPSLADERTIEAMIERLMSIAPERGKWPGTFPRVLAFSVALLQSADDLPGEGVGDLTVALVGPQRHLHLRFHDEARRRLLDIGEPDLSRAVAGWLTSPQYQALAELKAVVLNLLGPLQVHADQAGVLMGRASLLCELALDGCALELAAVNDVSRLPTGRRSTVVAALVDGKAHLRIFDKGGRIAADRPHAQINGISRQYVEDLLGGALKRTMDRRPKLTPKRQRDLIDAVSRLADYPMPACYPGEFEELRRTGSAAFRIPAPTPRMDLEANAFAGKTNVRLTRVRAWVHGVRTANGRCVVVIRHKGAEVVCSRDGQAIPFIHDPVDATFDYLVDEVAWGEKDRLVKNASTVIRVDGDLPVANDDGTVYPQLVGPFGEWEITIDSSNIDADRTGIDAIHLEFHGFAQTLERKASPGR